MHSILEMTREDIKKLQKDIIELPVIDSLYWTEEYIDKYLPFKI